MPVKLPFGWTVPIDVFERIIKLQGGPNSQQLSEDLGSARSPIVSVGRSLAQ